MKAATKTLEQLAVETAAVPLIDTHAHLHFDQLKGDVEGLLHRAEQAGVNKIVNVGVNTSDSKAAIELAARYENVWAAAGIHPHNAAEAEAGIKYLEELAGRRKVVAIGECGLDLFKSTSSLEQQLDALKLQVELAARLELPVIFHIRDAFDQFFELMDQLPKVRGVVHSFTAGPGELEGVLKHGWLVALNGITTFSKDEGHRLAVTQLPNDRLILETDCPFLAPAPHRGKVNQPAWVLDIAQAVAEIRGQSLAQLAVSTTRNAERLFGI